MAKALELVEDTGEVIVRIRAEQWTLQPPLLGHQRKLELLAKQLVKDASGEAEAAVAEVPADEVAQETAEEALGDLMSEGVASTLPWWRELFALCADRPLPPDDDCPLWMGSTLILAQLQVHWMLHPFRGLGLLAQPTPATTPALTVVPNPGS